MTRTILQLLHQVDFGVQSTGGVGEQHIVPPGPSRLKSVENHRRRIRPGLLGHHGDPVPFAPDLELFYGGRPEGVPRCQHDFEPLLFQPQGQLADGGGLARPVDAHHQNDKGPRRWADDQGLGPGGEHLQQRSIQ